jgi:hypothetical protein
MTLRSIAGFIASVGARLIVSSDRLGDTVKFGHYDPLIDAGFINLGGGAGSKVTNAHGQVLRVHRGPDRNKQ